MTTSKRFNSALTVMAWASQCWLSVYSWGFPFYTRGIEVIWWAAWYWSVIKT